MRLTRHGLLALVGVLAAGGLGVPASTQASSAGALSGSCELVTMRVTHVDGGNVVSTPGRGTCAITEFNGVALTANAAQLGDIQITSPAVTVECSEGVVRGVSGPVTLAVHGDGTDSFHVSMVLDSPSGAQTLNPTATVLIQGTRFVGTGTFTRSGPSTCGNGAGNATWTLGHLTFGDPAL